MVPAIEELKRKIETGVPGATVDILPNDTPAAQPSLLINRESLLETALFLRDDVELRLDFASNITGVDWLDLVTKEKVKVKKNVDGAETEVEEVIEKKRPGHLEVVYHLYSMALKHGPVVIRARTGNRSDDAHLPSLTPVWRSAEFQEREIFDLYGVTFHGHPDLRRILMWDGYTEYPMRKDYSEPDDYEYEPTPHDDVLARTKSHWPSLEGKSER